MAENLLVFFWHIFCLCAGSNHRNGLPICQTRDLYIRIHNLKLPCSRKFIGRRFMHPKVGIHGWKLWNLIILVKCRNREISFRNHVSSLHFIEISPNRCAARNVSVYRRRWCTYTVPRVHVWRDHVLWCRALSCTIRALISLIWLVETVFLKKSYSLQQYYFITPGSLTAIWPRKY